MSKYKREAAATRAVREMIQGLLAQNGIEPDIPLDMYKWQARFTRVAHGTDEAIVEMRFYMDMEINTTDESESE